MSVEHPFLSCEQFPPWGLMTNDHIKSDILHAIDVAKANIEAICTLKDDDINYETTFHRLEQATLLLEKGWGRVNHFSSVNDNPELRKEMNEVLPTVTEFYSSIDLNPILWSVIKKAEEHSKTEKLNDEQRRYIHERVEDFRQNGADLPEASKKRIIEINVELSRITKQYSETILDSANAFEYYVTDENELKGIPELAKEQAKEDAKSKGKPDAWRFTVQYTSRLPVMQFAESEKLRKIIWEATIQVGTGKYSTEEMIYKILSLRHESAQILGYKTFADYVTARRMVRNGNAALNFVNSLHDRIENQFNEEIRVLRAYKNRAVDGQLKPWEVLYWSEKQRKELYDFDEEELRPYFSVEKVMSGMFRIVSELYDISIVERPAFFRENPQEQAKEGCIEVWNPEVKCYEITENQTQKIIGFFYADWYPRDSKKRGAWMNILDVGNYSEGKPHLGYVVGSLTKPVGSKPALLSHDDALTIFHEFGHAMHVLLYEGTVSGLYSFSVPWDFVELPSQLMENFCWERSALDLFASHYETNQKIPDELFNKMIAARNYQSAIDFMRQLSFGKIDLEIHQNYDSHKEKQLEMLDEEILHNYRISFEEKTPSKLRDFSHIFSSSTGYAAGYYSYKWAEVLDADAFTRFLKEGILNRETGMDFRKKILAKGNTIPVEEQYRQYMGRDPDLAALLKRSGIKD